MRSFIFISIPRCLQLGINTGILQALGTIIGKDVRSQVELARQELEALQEEDRMTPDLVFRDPYLLDFLGLADTYSERDLEVAILRELERFLLELWHRLLLHRPAEAHDHRREGLLLLSGPALLQPQPAPAGSH